MLSNTFRRVIQSRHIDSGIQRWNIGINTHPLLATKGLIRYSTNNSTLDLVKHWEHQFHQHHIPEAHLSILYLIGSLLDEYDIHKLQHMIYESKRPFQLSNCQLEQLHKLCLRRLKHEPLQYIIGHWDFHVLSNLRVRAPTLIPRPETEQLVELALVRTHTLVTTQCHRKNGSLGAEAYDISTKNVSRKNNSSDNSARPNDETQPSFYPSKFIKIRKQVKRGKTPIRILDIGTGSGAIALAIACSLLETTKSMNMDQLSSFPNIIIDALDVEHDACQLASENAAEQLSKFTNRSSLKSPQSRGNVLLINDSSDLGPLLNFTVYHGSWDQLKGVSKSDNLAREHTRSRHPSNVLQSVFNQTIEINDNSIFESFDGLETMELTNVDKKFPTYLHEPYDIIVSNPPYVDWTERNSLNDQVVKYESERALFGGTLCGLERPLDMLKFVANITKTNTIVLLELGERHGSMFQKAFSKDYKNTEDIREGDVTEYSSSISAIRNVCMPHFSLEGVYSDFAGHARFVELKHN